MPTKRKEESVARQSNHAGESGAVLVELLSETVVYQQYAKIYPHIYPLWGIAFSCVIDYPSSEASNENLSMNQSAYSNGIPEYD